MVAVSWISSSAFLVAISNGTIDSLHTFLVVVNSNVVINNKQEIEPETSLQEM
jgi:hypothetical protein